VDILFVDFLSITSRLNSALLVRPTPRSEAGGDAEAENDLPLPSSGS
jgi:hypothetical protein